MRVAVLGPLEVHNDHGQTIPVGGDRLRVLLALLALHAGQVVPTERLIDGLWDHQPPAGVANALQSLVSRLRRTLAAGGTEPIRSQPAGYRLDIPPEHIDAHRFTQLAHTGAAHLAAGDHPAAAATLTEALALWRGPALVDIPAPFATPAATQLGEQRLQTIENLGETHLALGQPDHAAATLTQAAADHPLREKLASLTIRALAGTGRQADALACYQRTRQALADDLGMDPAPDLAALHLATLRGQLGPPPTPDTPSRPGRQRTNLRTGLSSYIGRDRETGTVRKLLADNRLVTLTGPGGTGKTRLATEAAAGLLDRHPDGVWLAELAPVTEPREVPHAVLTALGSSELHLSATTATHTGPPPPGVDPTQRLRTSLAGRNLLLILDNCEHLIDAAAHLADTLLASCPGITILATSRAALGITGETLHPVPALELPTDHADLTEAGSTAAVRLLADRAAAVRPGFTITADNITAVSQICHRLDGAPLALELAAARLRTLNPQQIVDRLDNRFHLLTRGSRTALPRHQTLRAVVSWSWDLLDEPARALARRLSVFAGGATLPALEQVCASPDLPAAAILDALTGLVDQSIVEATGEDPVRYRMLDTIRAYSTEQLADAGETDQYRHAHARYYTALAERNEPLLRTGDQLDAMTQLGAEHDNLITALRWALDQHDTPLGLRLTAALAWYWMLLGYHAEGSHWGQQIIGLAGPTPPPGLAGPYAICLVVDQLNKFGEHLDEDGYDADQFRELNQRFTHLLATARQEGPLHPLLTLAEAGAAMFIGDNDTARTLITTAATGSHDPWLRAIGHLFAAHLAGAHHDTDQVGTHLETAADGFRAIGERWGLAITLVSLGEHLVLTGDDRRGADTLDEAWRIASQFFGERERPGFLARLAGLRLRTGDLDTAETEIAQARALHAALGPTDPPGQHDTSQIAFVEAEILRCRGHHLKARDKYQQLLADLTGRKHIPPQLRTSILASLARAELELGNPAAADTHLRDALLELAPSRDLPVLELVLQTLILTTHAHGDPWRAAVLHGAATAVRPRPDTTDTRLAHTLDAIRTALGPDRYHQAKTHGATLDFAGIYQYLDIPLPEPAWYARLGNDKRAAPAGTHTDQDGPSPDQPGTGQTRRR